MHNYQVRFRKEENNIITTIVRNTSCNSGWLRLVVQIIFGTLIASSFILIMLMVLGKAGFRPSMSSRCSVSNCRVTCNDAPFYGDYEDDIINAASEAEAHCESIALKLIQPTFKNFQIPENWLARMRTNVRELAIFGGNLKYIAPHAFMNQFSNNIRVLILEEIELRIWERDIFVGLSSLRKLFLSDCVLLDIRKDALTAIDDSLEFLDIKASNMWDPVNVTGSSRLLELNIVDFSGNNFHRILRNVSFTRLKACKMLYLNSCEIVSLEPGTFDYLDNIEVLYLNDNLLINIPVGLFDRILPHKPRIALQDNLWYCDCSNEDLRNIIRNALLIVDPMCHYPEAMANMSFTDFEGYCNTYHFNYVNSDQLSVFKSNLKIENVSNIMYINGACRENNSSRMNQVKYNPPLRVIAPSEQQNCLLNRINTQDVKTVDYTMDNDATSISSNWIKPVFFVQSNPYSMIEITSSELPGHGLLWYQSSCAHTVYCVNTIPNILKIFNVHLSNYFTFCPFNLSSGEIIRLHCVSYNLANRERDSVNLFNRREIILYICISLGCLFLGAVCVYGLIQRNPSLLKGSKRVLFVKHRSINALILPPKLPMRKGLNESSATRHNYEKKKIFFLPHKLDILTCQKFARSTSMKSNQSGDDSYISALQPTEEQLCEWRSNQIAKQFHNTPTSDFSMLPYSRIYEQESLPYYSFHSNERIYEVPK